MINCPEAPDGGKRKKSAAKSKTITNLRFGFKYIVKK